MWNVKAKVIPAIIWTIGTTSNPFTQYLSNTPGRHETKKLQKTVTCVAAHIGLLRKARYSNPYTVLDRP